uniref:NAD(P)(+)--arginine ADP-ribosyltransferase n=1 Tax=Catharus ustulatus TaxID=91951 RepID=A0A8C3UQ59_CATUS
MAPDHCPEGPPGGLLGLGMGLGCGGEQGGHWGTPGLGSGSVPLDMAQNSFDDQYLTCADNMTEKVPELKCTEFLQNEEFAQHWSEARDVWEKRGRLNAHLSQDEAVALMMYTMGKVHKEFNNAVHEAGYSYQQYQNNFHFKMLHFLLTRALQKLRDPNKCQNVFKGESGKKYKVKKGDEVRFGYFASTSLSRVTHIFGSTTVFKVKTCHGVYIRNFSKFHGEKEVLIPPFEKFKVIKAIKGGKKVEIHLDSIGIYSKYNCERWGQPGPMETPTGAMGTPVMTHRGQWGQGHPHSDPVPLVHRQCFGDSPLCIGCG